MKKVLRAIFIIFLSIAGCFVFANIAGEIKFKIDEQQYLRNPTAENLYIFCEQYAYIDNDVAIQYIPKLCIENQIADSEFFTSKTLEEQQACKDKFLAAYVEAYLNEYDLRGYKQALLQCFDLIQNDDILYNSIQNELYYHTDCYEAVEEKFKVLDILYEAACENGNTNQILSALVFADTMCIKYNLGEEKTEYYKSEYKKVFKTAYPDSPLDENIDNLWHYDENGNVIWDGIQNNQEQTETHGQSGDGSLIVTK